MRTLCKPEFDTNFTVLSKTLSLLFKDTKFTVLNYDVLTNVLRVHRLDLRIIMVCKY